MKIDLPLETWTEVFGFVPRSQLVAFSPHIHDRQFASVLQFFLHKCGQITLGQIHIRTSRNGNGPIIFHNNSLTEGPIPSNVVNFKEIRLSYLDSSVYIFMQELLRNSLMANVNLNFEGCTDNLTAFLDTILPLISGINSIKLFGFVFCTSAYSQLEKPILKAARVLETWDCLSYDWYCEWLYSPREDGKPRILVLNKYGSQLISFIEHIKKDFLSSKRAISFFIRLHPFSQYVQMDLQNGETGEKLEIKQIGGNKVISRHPIGANEEWIKEMSKKPNNEYRNIIIS